MLPSALLVVTIFASTAKAINDDQALKYVSDYILYGLNPNSKPCDNVYDFFCGNWLAKIPTTNDTDYNYEDKKLMNKTNAILLEAIKAIDINDKRTPMYKIWLKTFFDQCDKNNNTVNDLIKQIFNGIQRVIGPPPMLITNATAKDALMKRNIWNLAGQIQRKLVEGVFFRTTVSNVMTDCGLEQPAITFEPLWSIDISSNVTEIRSNLLIVSDAFGLKLNGSDIDEKIRKMMEFWTDLKNYTDNSSQIDDNPYGTISISSSTNLSSTIPSVDWKEFFKGLFSVDQLNYWDQNHAKFQLRNLKYFQQLDKIVKKYDVETIYNAIFYQAFEKNLFLAGFSGWLSDNNCVQWTLMIQSAASIKVYFEYIKQNTSEWRSDLNVVVDNIFTAFKRLVAKTKWLSVQEIDQIYRKINEISFISPIPEWLDSDETVENVTIKFDTDKGLYDNSLNMAKRIFVLELDRYVTNSPSEQKIEFSQSTTYFNYEITTNFLLVLPPLYHFNYPPAIKYALFGSRIATALLQGFVEENLQERFGSKTLLNETNANKMRDQVNCINDQITHENCPNDAQKCSDHGWMWDRSLNNLLKEIDGLKIAYEAYKMNAENRAIVFVPGLENYNMDQIFFLSYGRSFCHSYLIDSSDEGGMDAKKNRLVKIFRNFPMFGQSFQCQKDTSSFLSKPCGVWGTAK